MTDNLNRLPFSLTFADLLGYIAPGGVLLLSAYLFEAGAAHLLEGPLKGAALHLPMVTLVGLLIEAAQQDRWLIPAGAAAAFLLTLYVSGHVISSFSSMFIERTLVFKGYGFPYETQLGFDEPATTEGRRWRRVSSAFYRGAFLLFNIYVLLRFGAAVVPNIYVLPWRASLWWTANAAGVVLVATIACKFILGKAHSRAMHRSEGDATPDSRDSGLGRGMEQLVERVAKPYDGLARLIAGIMGTRRVFDDAFRKRYSDLFQKRFGLSAEVADTNNFWLCYAHVMHTSSALSARVLNWQTLYGFARNLAAAFFGAFLYALLWYRLNSEVFETASAYGTRLLACIPLIYYSLALTLLLRYYYLYRGYFTKFVLRAFVYLMSDSSGAPR
jgi:hypothetical protein